MHYQIQNGKEDADALARNMWSHVPKGWLLYRNNISNLRHSWWATFTSIRTKNYTSIIKSKMFNSMQKDQIDTCTFKILKGTYYPEYIQTTFLTIHKVSWEAVLSNLVHALSKSICWKLDADALARNMWSIVSLGWLL